MTLRRPVGKTRLALGCVLLLLAAVTGCASFSRAVTTISPDLAIRIWPWNGAALARMASQRLDLEDDASVAQALSLAGRALAVDPLNSVAMRTIGLAETKRQRLPQALRAFSLVERMTRRDVGTNLWMIEYYADRNDVDAVLVYYDRALRTSGAAPALMFPILLKALEDDGIRSSFIKRFHGNAPDWVTDFFAFAVGDAKAPAAFADVFVAVPSAARAVPEDKVAIFVDRMAHILEPAAAKAAMRVYQRRTGRAIATRHVDFVDVLANADSNYLFDWTPASPGEVAIDRGDGAAILLVSARVDFSGRILQRTVGLTPGRYILRVATGRDALPVEVAVTCTASAAPLPVTNGEFSIGADCPLQNIVLSVNQGGESKIIGPFSIVPATTRK